MRTIETKSGVTTLPDGIELGHNNLVGFSATLLRTINGDRDMENAVGNRIGDKITLLSMQIKGMVELNERYSDVGIKVLIIKSAKGDVPTNAVESVKNARWSMSPQEAGDALERIVEFQVQIKGHNQREYEDKWQG